MVNLGEKLSEFKILIYTQTDDDVEISKHKLFILFVYSLSFIFVFLHFGRLPSDIIVDLRVNYNAGSDITIPGSGLLSLALIIYLYISFMAIVTIFRNGKLPNRSNLRFPSFRRRYKILMIVFFLLFTGFTLGLVYISLFGTLFLTLYLGPVMFYIWMVLEPFFLLSGILVFTDIIDIDYHFQGYTRRNKLGLLAVILIGFISPFYFAWFLFQRTPPGEFADFDILGITTISLYKPAVIAFTRTFTSILTLAIIFIILWWIKDIFRGKNEIRERKKGLLPWLLPLTLIFITFTVVPIMLTTRGSLTQIQDIWDLMSLITALILGLWRVLGLGQRVEPLKGWERMNPGKIVSRIHPYAKALVLLTMSMFAFFASIQAATIAKITEQPNALQILQLTLLAEFIGLAFIIIVWQYQGQPRSDSPGLIKTTQNLMKEKIRGFKDSF